MFDRLVKTIGRSNYLKQAFETAALLAGQDQKSELASLFFVKSFSIDYSDLYQFGTEYKSLAEKYMAKESSGDSPIATVLIGAIPEA